MVQNVSNEKPIEVPDEKSSIFEEATLKSTMSDDMVRFCEAVVHPFGNDAIGAILPDKYSDLVVPVTDRVEFDLSPQFLNFEGDWTSETDNPGGLMQLLGVFMWFQPRCVAAGVIDTYIDYAQAANLYVNPFISIDPTFSPLGNRIILDDYLLCYTGVWANNSAGANSDFDYGFFDITGSTLISNRYVCIEYSRFLNIKENCDKMRVLGAGIKLWSEEAPINTGGYSIGGWINFEDIMQAMRHDTTTNNPADPGALLNIQTSIRFPVRTPGLGGSTVRYSSLQDMEQLDLEYPRVPDRLWVEDNPGYVDPTTGTSLTSATNIIHPNRGVDLAINDVITPGSMVPCIYWAFNVNRTAASSGNNTAGNGAYTLKVSSIVHGEAAPTGTCPFQTYKKNSELAAEHVKSILSNVDTFPVAATGHSFKSFMKKAKHFVTGVSKGAGHFANLMKQVDKWAGAIE
jgi:hypothetical protein